MRIQLLSKPLAILFGLMLCLMSYRGTSSIHFEKFHDIDTIPQWILDDWAVRTTESGNWIADNSAYKNDAEPFDEYGIKWEYGIGNSHLKGVLYMIQDGTDVGSAWEFTEFWDPASQELKVVQIGTDGTVGQGRIWRDSQGLHIERQTYTSPAGFSFETGHHSWVKEGINHTKSFEIKNEQWIEGRYYEWRLK